MADIPVVAWDESSPDGSQGRSLGDDRIREMKTQIREILEVDHVMSSSGQGSTWGQHNKVTLQEQASDPTYQTNTIILYSKEVSSKAELHYIDEDGNTMQLTSGGDFIGGFAGEVRIFTGLLSAIPTGWALCDGTGGTPNLLGKFVKSVPDAVTNPGTTGGQDSVTLTSANMPSHNHTITVGSDGSHYHSFGVYFVTGLTASAYSAGSGQYLIDTYTNVVGTTSTDGAHTHTATSSNTGSGTAFDNRPAYYEVAFITRS